MLDAERMEYPEQQRGDLVILICKRIGLLK
jgi:hypothetical protein